MLWGVGGLGDAVRQMKHEAPLLGVSHLGYEWVKLKFWVSSLLGQRSTHIYLDDQVPAGQASKCTKGLDPPPQKVSFWGLRLPQPKSWIHTHTVMDASGSICLWMHSDIKTEFTSGFQAEDEFSHRKLQNLKQEIQKRGLPVKFFKTPEELAKIVLEDWTRIISRKFPALEDLVNELCEFQVPCAKILPSVLRLVVQTHKKLSKLTKRRFFQASDNSF